MIMIAGMLSVKSLKSSFLMFPSIKMPMIIKMGAMALSGITLITGINNSDRMNSTPVTTEVKPVLPPDAIPAAVSTVATVGLEPNIA